MDRAGAVHHENLSDSDIDKAFANLPKELKDGTSDRVKLQLKIRKTHLSKYAREYYKTLMRTVLVVGTEKKDKFVITRLGNATKVQTYRMKKREKSSSPKEPITAMKPKNSGFTVWATMIF
jgi:hypothetical protein